MDLSTAINRIAEQTYKNKKLWSQSLKQRRTEFTDIYGVPYYSEVDSTKTFQCHISISPDLEYYERFQFKLVVQTSEAFDPNGFDFYMTDAETYDEGAYEGEDYDWIDISDKLEEQTGVWPTGDGYFPSDGSRDGEYYDILDVGCMLDAEGQEDVREMLLAGGNKIIKIKSPVAATITLVLFLKYSSFGV